jgi:cation-transporting ATPase 13A3/4/5
MCNLLLISQILWCASRVWISYLVVGALLGAVVLISGTVQIVINRMNQAGIARLTKHSTVCEVLRGGEWLELSSEELVPGDVVKIKSDWLLPCDFVILEGQCVCNESALTGTLRCPLLCALHSLPCFIDDFG